MSKRKAPETSENEDSAESDCVVSTTKRLSQKKNRVQVFLNSYTDKFPTLVRSRKGPSYARCTLCDSDFSVGHAGNYDCKRHVESKGHKEFERSNCGSAKKQGTLSSFFKQPAETPAEKLSLEMDITRAEAMLCHIIADSNLSLATADKLTRAMKVAFPDSKIAAGQNIFNLIDAEFRAHTIPWANCPSLGCDNANVMTGRHKGVFGLVGKEHEQVFLAGCTLHMVHNAAKKAAVHMPPFETALMDIYFYFDKSCDRKARFKGTQDIFDVEQRKMIKHVPTRWLSISRCLQRLLDNWDPLKVFFGEEKESLTKRSQSKGSYAASKIENIFSFLRSPTNCLYCLFLVYIVKVFDEFMVSFQSEQPKIHKLKRGMETLLMNIFCRFVKPSARKGKNVHSIEYKIPSSMCVNEELGIGEDARMFLQDKDGNHLRESRIAEFYKNVQAYFVELVDYLMSCLPLDDPVLHHAEVADVALQDKATVQSVRFFLTRYPCLLPPETTINTLIEQFTAYQETDVSACLSERMDETWANIGSLNQNDTDSHSQSFQELSIVMRGVLTIPHSSAHCERVFSTVRKNRTPQRASLAESTLESLLVVKSITSDPVEAVSRLKSDKLLALKGAYARSLKNRTEHNV